MRFQIKNKLSMHYNELAETVGAQELLKAFQPFTGQGDGRSRARTSGVELADFCR